MDIECPLLRDWTRMLSKVPPTVAVIDAVNADRFTKRDVLPWPKPVVKKIWVFMEAANPARRWQADDSFSFGPQKAL